MTKTLFHSCESNPFTGCENDYYFDRNNNVSFKIFDHQQKRKFLGLA